MAASTRTWAGQMLRATSTSTARTLPACGAPILTCARGQTRSRPRGLERAATRRRAVAKDRRAPRRAARGGAAERSWRAAATAGAPGLCSGPVASPGDGAPGPVRRRRAGSGSARQRQSPARRRREGEGGLGDIGLFTHASRDE